MCPDRPPIVPADDLSLSAYAEWLTDWLDEKAGRYRLSDWERYVQRECRREFLFYCPTDYLQAAFIDRLADQRRYLEWLKDEKLRRAG